jgi:hypothetical protein
MSTERSRANLAVRPLPERVHPKLTARRRLNALVELFADATRKPDAIHAQTRKQPRSTLPDERERTLIDEGIASGAISPERLIRYRLFQLQCDLAQFPSAAPQLEELIYVRLVREEAEAIEAQAIARALPTPANRADAVRESKEAVAALSLYVAAVDG